MRYGRRGSHGFRSGGGRHRHGQLAALRRCSPPTSRSRARCRRWPAASTAATGSPHNPRLGADGRTRSRGTAAAGASVNERISANFRAQHGLSPEAPAQVCDVSRSALSLIERGESSPTAVVHEKIASGLEVSLVPCSPRATRCGGIRHCGRDLSRRDERHVRNRPRRPDHRSADLDAGGDDRLHNRRANAPSAIKRLGARGHQHQRARRDPHRLHRQRHRHRVPTPPGAVQSQGPSGARCRRGASR